MKNSFREILIADFTRCLTLVNPQALWRSAAGVALVAVQLCALTACGQKSGLFLPTDPLAAQRATLPQTLVPARSSGGSSAAKAPASSAVSPNVSNTSKPTNIPIKTITLTSPETPLTPATPTSAPTEPNDAGKSKAP